MVQQIKLLFHFICPLFFISGCAGTYTATQDDVDMGFADEIGQSVKWDARTKARKRYLNSPDYAYEQQIQDLEKALDAGEITDAQYKLLANQAKSNRDILNSQARKISNQNSSSGAFERGFQEGVQGALFGQPGDPGYMDPLRGRY